MEGSTEGVGTSPAILKKGAIIERRYKILGFLGEGDRKRTYLAQDTHLGRKVALAIIKRVSPGDFIPEWQVLAQIAGHYNIVTLFDRGTADDKEYLVFEYLSGGTLRDHIRKRTEPLTAGEAMQLGRQLARALSHIHRKGLIHRDVAPSNIWLDERKAPHLGDFDSAVLRDAKDDGDSRFMTTGGYAAPEPAAGGAVDERSDLYSLGAVLYETVTGQRPPPSGPRRNAEITGCLAARRPVLPHRMNDMICKLLAEDPHDRPESADQVLRALEINREPLDSEDVWISTLPFPLASVLWLYLAEPEPADKVESLLRFFESLAQFTATVLLSAGMSDHAFLEAHRQDWFDGGPDGPRPLDLRVPTFGTWVELTKRLALTCRLMLADHGDEAARCLRIFTAMDTDLIEALVSKRLDEILQHACARRNEWIGHGGRKNPKVLRDRLTELEEVLAPLIRMIADDDTGEEACYFYNRTESDQVRWVSYHYLGVPERRIHDEDVLTFVSALTPQPVRGGRGVA